MSSGSIISKSNTFTPLKFQNITEAGCSQVESRCDSVGLVLGDRDQLPPPPPPPGLSSQSQFLASPLKTNFRQRSQHTHTHSIEGKDEISANLLRQSFPVLSTFFLLFILLAPSISSRVWISNKFLMLKQGAGVIEVSQMLRKFTFQIQFLCKCAEKGSFILIFTCMT